MHAGHSGPVPCTCAVSTPVACTCCVFGCMHVLCVARTCCMRATRSRSHGVCVYEKAGWTVQSMRAVDGPVDGRSVQRGRSSGRSLGCPLDRPQHEYDTGPSTHACCGPSTRSRSHAPTVCARAVCAPTHPRRLTNMGRLLSRLALTCCTAEYQPRTALVHLQQVGPGALHPPVPPLLPRLVH